MAEPRWLVAARQQIGQAEIHGRKNNPRILQWWTAIRAPFTDDETPWCAAFVGGMLESVGIRSSRSAAARSYEKWGIPLKNPAIGAIVTFSRKGGGHVGFVVGQSATSVAVLGGNQGDAVNIRNFPKNGSSLRVTSYRWPANEPLPSAMGEQDIGADDGGRVTFIGQPDDPGVDEEKPTFWQRAKNWIMGGSGIGALSSFYDWRVAAVFAVVALIVFFALLYTKRI